MLNMIKKRIIKKRALIIRKESNWKGKREKKVKISFGFINGKTNNSGPVCRQLKLNWVQFS